MKDLQTIVNEFKTKEGVEKINRIERCKNGFKIFYEITSEYKQKHMLEHKYRICELESKTLKTLDYSDMNIVTSFDY